jgi:hypothetical protein
MNISNPTFTLRRSAVHTIRRLIIALGDLAAQCMVKRSHVEAGRKELVGFAEGPRNSACD